MARFFAWVGRQGDLFDAELSGNVPAPPGGFELREDASFELRENDGESFAVWAYSIWGAAWSILGSGGKELRE